MDRVLIIDSQNFAWKANVVFKPKPQVEGYEDKKEEPVKDAPPQDIVVCNYFRNFRALVDIFNPHQIIDVREGHPSFRYELYPEYKANRIIKTAEAATKSDISRRESKTRFDAAYPEICRLMKFLPVSVARHPCFEADDVIASLAENLKEEDVIVVSGDSDLLQLCQLGYKNFRLYHPIKKTMQTPKPYHYVTWKSLRGDTSDNIPKIMSDKKALALVNDPAALKEWLEKSEENRAQFQVNRQLIELTKINLDEVEFESYVADYDRIKIEFTQYGFNSLVANPYFERFCSTFRAVKLPAPKSDGDPK